MKSRICDLLGIEFPLIAFTHCRDVVVEVSKAGGMGVMGVSGMPAEQLEIEVALMDHPWNRDTSKLSRVVRERIVRCRGWSEIIERFPAP